jgi:hypothetical protein
VLSSAGYAAAIARADVDALVFEDLVRRYELCDVADVDDVAVELGDRYEELLDLYAMWRANPALPFAGDSGDDHLAAAYFDFERYWDCLKRCIMYCEPQPTEAADREGHRPD